VGSECRQLTRFVGGLLEEKGHGVGV